MQVGVFERLLTVVVFVDHVNNFRHTSEAHFLARLAKKLLDFFVVELIGKTEMEFNSIVRHFWLLIALNMRQGSHLPTSIGITRIKQLAKRGHLRCAEA
jgi:hypothetical protein